MSQHLYPCEQCGAYGVAHYVLAHDGAGWFNVLLCTGCFTDYRRGACPPATRVIRMQSVTAPEESHV